MSYSDNNPSLKKTSSNYLSKLKIISAVLALLFIFSSCSKGGNELKTGGEYMMATGKNGGTYYSLGTAFENVIDKALGSTTTLISSTGSVDNIDIITKGDADFAFCQSDILYYALNGKEMFYENFKKGISVVANLYTESVQVVVNADSEIENISDLKGCVVAVGDYGTATEAAARAILDAYNVSYNDITLKYQSFKEASSGLASGIIDAAFVVSALPSASVYDYSEIMPIRCLPISISSASRLKRTCPFFTDGIIPSEIYGCPNTVSTLNIDILLICRSDMPSDDVYSVVSSLYDHIDELKSAHIKGSDMFVETASFSKIGSYHSGAKQYYDSINLDEIKPDDTDNISITENESSQAPENYDSESEDLDNSSEEISSNSQGSTSESGE